MDNTQAPWEYDQHLRITSPGLTHVIAVMNNVGGRFEADARLIVASVNYMLSLDEDVREELLGLD